MLFARDLISQERPGLRGAVRWVSSSKKRRPIMLKVASSRSSLATRSGLIRRAVPGIAFVAFALATSQVDASEAAEFLYVENTDSGDISVISIPEHEVVSTIKLGVYPDDLTASSDGRTLYTNR